MCNIYTPGQVAFALRNPTEVDLVAQIDLGRALAMLPAVDAEFLRLYGAGYSAKEALHLQNRRGDAHKRLRAALSGLADLMNGKGGDSE
jgi:hypothetical protein